MTAYPLSYAVAFCWRPATWAEANSLNVQLAGLCLVETLRSPQQPTPGTARAD